jgi:hypothetical protein
VCKESSTAQAHAAAVGRVPERFFVEYQINRSKRLHYIGRLLKWSQLIEFRSIMQLSDFLSGLSQIQSLKALWVQNHI